MEAVLPVLFALVTAFAFAVSTVLVRVGVRESSPLVALVITMAVNVVVLWGLSLAWYDVSVDLWSWRWFILAGIFAPALGRLANYIGIQRVGANLVSPITNMNPLVSVGLAIVLLGERLPLPGYVGVMLAVAGGVVLASVRGDGFTRVRRTDLLFPLFGALTYGTVQIFRKIGTNLVAEPTIGAAVNLTTSFVLVAGGIVATGRLETLVVPRRDALTFVAAGVVSSLGLASLYAALSLGQVTVVTPIFNASPLFVLLLTGLFVRDGELFSKRVLVGTVTIVAGVAILTMWT
ncbi:DMT family transporter [Haloferax larsenii]|uniref:DMT family transporter n=1 Tax=Haloferax larsenii TaxID=302484 RepID=A0ABY5RFA3_HALLR|nr:DMT family transporter [Haloferax larsenii]UVE51031.1 DMT family transporter [Haloferax larsenii]